MRNGGRKRGAEERISDASIKTIYKNSRYAERLPIGKIEVLENFKKETIDRFYQDWYRPDLMAVIAVGDFESSVIREKIDRYFSKFPLRNFRRKRLVYDIPERKGTDYLVISDKEATKCGNQNNFHA